MAFRRGFKSQCERRAVEFRRDFGLANVDPLSAFQLAEFISVTVWSVREVANMSNNDLCALCDESDDSWSAFTLRSGINNLVVYKPISYSPRVNSVVMHELSHIILGHDLADAGILADGSLSPSNYNQEQEDEADWLAGTLLLPRPALLKARSSNLTSEQICEKYRVSPEMLEWRIRMTGVDYQLGRKPRKVS